VNYTDVQRQFRKKNILCALSEAVSLLRNGILMHADIYTHIIIVHFYNDDDDDDDDNNDNDNDNNNK
jgi:hypothetical protein